MRWEGAVNGRSDACGYAEVQWPRSLSAGKRPSSPNLPPEGQRLANG